MKYGSKLIFASNAFQLGMTTPAAATAIATKGQRVGGQEGNLAVAIVCRTALTMAITKKLTISLTDCDTETGTYAAVAPALSQITTYAAAKTFAVDELIARLIIPPGVRKWVKVSITTDDAAVEGTIDVFVEYLAN